jgi:hypothetical protein
MREQRSDICFINNENVGKQPGLFRLRSGVRYRVKGDSDTAPNVVFTF